MKTVLAIDGGGIRGLIPAMLLAEIERRGINLQQSVDLIVGTSTGGILGLFLALNKPASAAVDLYRFEGPRIFHRPPLRRILDWATLWRPKFVESGIREALEEHFGDARMSECKPMVAVTAAQIANMQSCILRSWSWDWRDQPVAIAARATSAAPTYFPPTDEGFIDGGVWANNPSHVAMYLARELWPGEKYRLLSLGCGKSGRFNLPRETKHWGLLHLAPRLPAMLMGCGEDFAENVATAVLGDGYLRVQTNLEAVDSEMSRCDETHIRDLVSLSHRSTSAQVARIMEFLR